MSDEQSTLEEQRDAWRKKSREYERRTGRSCRKRDVRSRTISPRYQPVRALDAIRSETDAILDELGDIERPRTRGDCENGPRPCPWVSCAHHLYLDLGKARAPHKRSVSLAQSIKLNFPDVAPEDLDRLPATCALDVADEGGETLERVGEVMNMTRERVRQIENAALPKVHAEIERRKLTIYREVG